MARGVTVKGTGRGIILVLDREMSFDDLAVELAGRIAGSADFYGSASIPVTIRGRVLSEEEKDEIAEIIRANSRISVTELVVEAPVETKHLTAEEIFDGEPADAGDGAGDADDEDRYVGGDTEELSAMDRAILKELEKQMSGEFAVMHAGPVKSGETIRSEYSLIILGDVRRGGRVEASGSIIVMGNLYGEAVAGSEGNRSAIVASGNLKPSLLSIGSLTGYRASGHFFRKPFGKKRLMEAACVKNGEIVRMAYPDFIAENRLS